MIIPIKEQNLEEIQEKLSKMNTDLNKLLYLESALKEPDFSFEIKRYLWKLTAKLYEERKMYEKAAKAMSNKGATEITQKDRMESYLKSAELYAKCGKINEAENIFIKASREVSIEQQGKIKLAQKNIYLVFAKELEENNKKASALKFYEKLIKMKIDPLEKRMVNQKLFDTYKALGMFHEAKMLEGMIQKNI